jgi:hypothetical protein
VDSVDPLRVVLDGDTYALPYTPIMADAARALVEGDRVLGAIVTGRFCILAGLSGSSLPPGDHGGLAGLSDDDHTQYLNSTRHAATDHSGVASKVISAYHGVLTADGATGTGWVYSGLGKQVGAVASGDIVRVKASCRTNTSDNGTAIVFTNGAIGGSAPAFTNQILCLTAPVDRSANIDYVCPSAYADLRVYLYCYRTSSSYVYGGTASERYTWLSVVHERP